MDVNNSSIFSSDSPSLFDPIPWGQTNNSSFGDITSTFSNVSPVINDFGPKRDPLSTVIPMTFVYAVILVTGVTGNICTCIVIARNRYMHTATNYYLFSLAISDLMLLVLGLPQELYQLWEKYPYVFGEAFCVIRGLTSETSTNASVLTITAFTVERYVAICHPLRAHTMSHLPRAIKTILAVWFVAAMCAIPLALQFGITYEETPGGEILQETALCSIKHPLPHAFEISTFLFFILPMSVISVLYVFIALRLRRAAVGQRENSPDKTKEPSGSNLSSRQSMSSRRAVVKMLVAVVVSFFMCWSPFHAQRLLAIYVTEPTEVAILTFTVLTYISGVTYYLSATVNPILYQLLSLKFRQAFKDTFHVCCPFLKVDKKVPDIMYSVTAAETRCTPGCQASLGCQQMTATTTAESPLQQLSLSPSQRVMSSSYSNMCSSSNSVHDKSELLDGKQTKQVSHV